MLKSRETMIKRMKNKKSRMVALALLCLGSLTSMAQADRGQWSLTPQMGVNRSYPDNEYLIGSLGLTAGLGANYQLANRMELGSGLFYTSRQLSVPLTVGVNVWRGLSIVGGAQADINIYSPDFEYESSSTYYTATLKRHIYTSNNTFSFLLPIGIRYEYRNIVADLHYAFALTKTSGRVATDMIGMSILTFDPTRQNMLQFTLGYKLEL